MRIELNKINDWEIFCCAVKFFLKINILVPAQTQEFNIFLEEIQEYCPDIYRAFTEYLNEYMKYY